MSGWSVLVVVKNSIDFGSMLVSMPRSSPLPLFQISDPGRVMVFLFFYLPLLVRLISLVGGSTVLRVVSSVCG
ncbi:unnamed protein product [Arabidopsis lyrata]|nr:unnamed protein product [Arabidopsis lyrata]